MKAEYRGISGNVLFFGKTEDGLHSLNIEITEGGEKTALGHYPTASFTQIGEEELKNIVFDA